MADLFFSITVLAAMAFGNVNHSIAAGANFSDRKAQQINSEGRKLCKSLRGSGFRASANGIIEVGNQVGYANFRIKTCFPTAVQCETFIQNIHRELGNIELLRKASCEPY